MGRERILGPARSSTHIRRTTLIRRSANPTAAGRLNAPFRVADNREGLEAKTPRVATNALDTGHAWIENALQGIRILLFGLE
jgi:hypothetical protein